MNLLILAVRLCLTKKQHTMKKSYTTGYSGVSGSCLHHTGTQNRRLQNQVYPFTQVKQLSRIAALPLIQYANHILASDGDTLQQTPSGLFQQFPESHRGSNEQASLGFLTMSPASTAIRSSRRILQPQLSGSMAPAAQVVLHRTPLLSH